MLIVSFVNLCIYIVVSIMTYGPNAFDHVHKLKNIFNK